MRGILLIASTLLLTSTLIIAPSTVPAHPSANRNRNASCELDLSSEMFGGVEEACGGRLDRSRCCPVLAAWLFAAHARTALRLPSLSSPPPFAKDPSPMIPETDSKRCADALQTALAARNITLPRPNATCDPALCFCGIHLHQLTSLSCSPAPAVRGLEANCRNASHAGCTRCLSSLEKLKGGGGGGGERVEKMMDKDCRLMGLTWLLGRNKTEYIPTVSAVLRAIMYSAEPPTPPYGCSSDQENMPLAVDSFEVKRAAGEAFSSGSCSAPWFLLYFVLALAAAVRVVAV